MGGGRIRFLCYHVMTPSGSRGGVQVRNRVRGGGGVGQGWGVRQMCWGRGRAAGGVGPVQRARWGWVSCQSRAGPGVGERAGADGGTGRELSPPPHSRLKFEILVFIGRSMRKFCLLHTPHLPGLGLTPPPVKSQAGLRNRPARPWIRRGDRRQGDDSTHRAVHLHTQRPKRKKNSMWSPCIQWFENEFWKFPRKILIKSQNVFCFNWRTEGNHIWSSNPHSEESRIGQAPRS